MSCDENNDSADLEALFDEVSAKAAANIDAPAATSVIDQIGQLARVLHGTLRSLGLEAGVEKATSDIPDVRARLEYVASLTNQAANKVMDATDKIEPQLSSISRNAKSLSDRWDESLSGKFDEQKFKRLVLDTRTHLNDEQGQVKIASAATMDIVLAQDFQDLTGQILKKVGTIICEVESQLLALLVEHVPQSKIDNHPLQSQELLNGPVINPIGRSDALLAANIVTNQDQVDEILASLGF